MIVQASDLTDFSNRCLVRVGVPIDEASVITHTMIEADIRGIHSHGLMRLPLYIQRIQNGLMLPVSKIEIFNQHTTTAVLDANYSAGQIAATRAMDLAIAKAAEHGLGAVLVRNSNHFGIAAHYALKASAKDMIGLSASNTTPLMPPTGGAERILGNNPLAIAAPANNAFPLLLDMALSNVALGKILYAKSRGVSIPEGWGADKNGKPTTEPAAVLDGGFVLPVGGPKGFGLAFMIELLTGVLAGGQFSKLIPSMYDLTCKQSIAHFMLVINVAHFIDIDCFKALATQLSSYVKSAIKAEGVHELYLPGEIEFRIEKQRMSEGIPLDEKIIGDLRDLAGTLNVSTEAFDEQSEE